MSRFRVPALPAEYLPREELTAIERDLLAMATAPVAVHGEAGVGKSVLAAAVARSPAVVGAFPDGVFWISLGREPDRLGLQIRWLRELGEEAGWVSDLGDGKRVLAWRLKDRACLLVLDDVRDAAHVSEAFEVLGGRSKLLLTSRRLDVLERLGATPHEIGRLQTPAALAMLAAYAGARSEALPAEAQSIVEAHGALPVALAGSLLRARPVDQWPRVLRTLRQSRLEEIEARFPNSPCPTLLERIEASVQVLEAEYPHCAARYRELAIFPEATPIPEPVLYTYFAPLGLDRDASRDVIDTLVDHSLLRRDERGALLLHDAQRDYVIGCCKDQASLHARLVQAYRDAAGGELAQGPRDGYFFEHLAWHLREAGQTAELERLLLDFGWLRAKLLATDIHALLSDFLCLERRTREDGPLARVEDALRRSRHVLCSAPEQLATRLAGHLLESADERIQRLLACARRAEPGPRLWPRHAVLTPAGGALPQTLDGHSHTVYAVALSSDGTRALSGSSDQTLKLWDLERGTLLRTLEAHSGWVYSVALSADGRRALSGSADNTLKLWDLESGTVIRTLQGHSDLVYSVALSADGTRALSGSEDQTLKLWDLQRGTVLRTLEGHSDSVLSVASSADGRRALSGSADETLKLWDLQSGTVLRTLEAHSGWVCSVALSADGTRALSGSADETLKLWDLESGTVLRTLDGYSAAVSSVALSPDGRRALSGSHDRTLKLWDLDRGTCLSTFTIDVPVFDVAWASSRVAAGDARGAVLFFDEIQAALPASHSSSARRG